MAGPLVLAAAAAFIAYKQNIEAKWLALFCYLLATAIAVAAVAASTGGDSMGRYTGPFQIPALLVFTAFVVRWRNTFNQHPLWFKGSIALVVVGLGFLAGAFGIRAGQYQRYAHDVGFFAPSKRFDIEKEKRRIAALQAAVPAGKCILVRLPVTFPFDFNRNPIFIADFVGMAGLPPGMPIGQGPYALRAYLLAHSIRYLAYDHERIRVPDHFPNASLQAVLANPAGFGRHSWLTVQCKVSEDAQGNFETLAKYYRHLYDDPDTFVLDLDQVSEVSICLGVQQLKPVDLFGASSAITATGAIPTPKHLPKLPKPKVVSDWKPSSGMANIGLTLTRMQPATGKALDS